MKTVVYLVKGDKGKLESSTFDDEPFATCEFQDEHSRYSAKVNKSRLNFEGPEQTVDNKKFYPAGTPVTYKSTVEQSIYTEIYPEIKEDISQKKFPIK